MTAIKEILEKSIQNRRSQLAKPLDEINGLTKELSEAVEQLSNDELTVKIQTLEPRYQSGPTFAIVLLDRDKNFERILKIIESSSMGYPLKLWGNFRDWDSQFSNNEPSIHIDNINELQNEFQRMVEYDSEIVRMISNLTMKKSISN